MGSSIIPEQHSKHSIGKTIAELRKEKGWKQAELAAKLQVSDKAISKWEKDSGSPSIEFFPALAELFGVTIDYILTGKRTEPEIVNISKIELCAKNDDVTLLDGINCRFKDENGKTIIDYILQYGSYNVFAVLCDKNKDIITHLNILDALKFAILSNRLDLLRGVTLKLGMQYVVKHRYFREHYFENENSILDLLPKKEIKILNGPCILTDEFFEMIVCDDRINQKTLSVLLGEQNERKCVWYNVYPYLIHQSYLHNKTNMLKRLLAQANKNNDYAYKNLNTNYYSLNFFFMGDIFDRNRRRGHGLVRILEETVKLALERGDFETFEKFNEINTEIVKYCGFNPYIASEYEIRMAKLKTNPDISKEEFTIQSCIHEGIVNIKELTATKDLTLIKTVLGSYNYNIHPVEIPYKMFNDKEWKNLFEYAIDNKLTVLADGVIRTESNIIKKELVKIFNNNSYNSFDLRGKNISDYSSNVEGIIEYLSEYRKQVISDFSDLKQKDKVIGGLTKEYFEDELEKGNTETVIVNLCKRLEAVLRYSYRFSGDFSEMLKQYCTVYVQDENYDGKTQRLLNALRMARNNIVHPEKTNVTLTIEDIRYCIDYICNLN